MRKYILLFILCIFTSAAFGQFMKPKKKKKEVRINYGLKGGFNSSMNLVKEFKIKDVTINEIQNNYRVGYFGSAFMRININRHFMQAEAMYNVNRSEVQFDKKGSQHPDVEPDYARIEATIHALEIPLTYGYNFVKKNPYEMYFFLGPQLKYVWKKNSQLELINLVDQNIQEEIYPVHISGVIGVGVRISHILFDFRYDIGLHNVSRHVAYKQIDEEGVEKKADITLNRRNNTISFSLGVIF